MIPGPYSAARRCIRIHFTYCSAAVQEAMQPVLTAHHPTGIQISVAVDAFLTCADPLGYADSPAERALTPATLMRIRQLIRTGQAG